MDYIFRKRKLMTTVIVKYSYPEKLTRAEAMEKFKQASEMFKDMDGLNSKQFTFDEEKQTCLSVYNWESLEKAKNLFSDDFIPMFKEKVGTIPTYEIYDCLLMVDNRAYDVISYV